MNANLTGPGTYVNDGLVTFLGDGFTKDYISSTIENKSIVKIGNNLSTNAAGSVLQNDVGATLEFVGDFGISVNNTFGYLTFKNAGLLLKSGGTGTSVINAVVTNTGTITEQSGHFSFPNGIN